MTNKEQESINSVYKLLSEIRDENRKFREDVTKQVESVNSKTDKKFMPVMLEQNILSTAQQAINDAIKTSLSAYGSPLIKLVQEVVSENSKELKSLVSDSFTTVIRTEDFKKSIVSAFSHKVAKTIISNNDGLFDKVSNELKQDAVFKSKMAIAVSNVVEECLKLKNGIS